MAQRLATAGVTGILNFAPLTLQIRGETCVTNVDLASEIQQLSFAVARQATVKSEPVPAPKAMKPADSQQSD